MHLLHLTPLHLLYQFLLYLLRLLPLRVLVRLVLLVPAIHTVPPHRLHLTVLRCGNGRSVLHVSQVVHSGLLILRNELFVIASLAQSIANLFLFQLFYLIDAVDCRLFIVFACFQLTVLVHRYFRFLQPSIQILL